MRLSLFLYFYALPAAAQAFWYFPYTLSAAARIPASLSQALPAAAGFLLFPLHFANRSAASHNLSGSAGHLRFFFSACHQPDHQRINQNKVNGKNNIIGELAPVSAKQTLNRGFCILDQNPGRHQSNRAEENPACRKTGRTAINLAITKPISLPISP